jgi:G3E family GTPase
VRGDLIRILHKLSKRRDKFDHVLIETTGEVLPRQTTRCRWRAAWSADRLSSLICTHTAAAAAAASTRCPSSLARHVQAWLILPRSFKPFSWTMSCR